MDPIEIDPAGDILLIVGKNHEADAPLLVSSNFLSFSSPVFATMLSERFSEGQDFTASQSNSSPYRLELPEDNYEGMRMLCYLLHLRHDAISPQHRTMKNFFQLGKASDKYDCGEALRLVVGTLLMPAEVRTSVWELRQLLPISYMFDNAVLFALISKLLILRDDWGFNSIDPDEIMPGKISCLLEEKRNLLRSQILLDLGSLLDRFLVPTEGETLNREFYELVGRNTHQLKMMLLLPFPIIESVDRILSMLDPKLLRKLDVTSFRYSTLNILMDDYAQEKRDGVLGLCLHCLRGREHDATDCRVALSGRHT